MKDHSVAVRALTSNHSRAVARVLDMNRPPALTSNHSRAVAWVLGMNHSRAVAATGRG